MGECACLEDKERRAQHKDTKTMKAQKEITTEEQNAIEHCTQASVCGIANIIYRHWKKPYFGAVPYMQAMRQMHSVSDNYGLDRGTSIVAYFLSNASTWRGPVAKAVKAELNKRLKAAR